MAFNLPTLPINPKQKITYTRPSDWPIVTDTTNEVKFLVCDVGASQSSTIFGISTTFDRTGSENLYIDWGDGSLTETISTNTATVTTHLYVPGTGTACSRGYTTFILRIWTDSGATITQARAGVYTTTSGGAANQQSSNVIVPILEAYFGDGVKEGTPFLVTGSQRMSYCEYVKMPSTFVGTSWNSYFTNYYSLQRITLPTSAPNVGDASSMFLNCYKLSGDIVLPSNAPITTMANMFQNCYNISSITYINSQSVSSMNTTFQNCYNLIFAKFGDLLSCNDFGSCFNNCYNLQSYEMGAWYLGGGAVSFTVSLSNMFLNCYSLEYIKWPTQIGGETGPGGTIGVGSVGGVLTAASMFSGCVSLKTVTLPVFYNSYVTGNLNQARWGSTQNMFSGCVSLISVIFTKGSTPYDPAWIMPPITGTAASMFLNCYSFTGFPNGYPELGNVASSMFQNCVSLKRLDATNLSAATSTTSTFNGCQQLSEIILPTSLATSSINSMFTNCNFIQEITMPTLLSCTDASSAFTNCFNLRSVVLPSTMNNCSTFASCFSGCFNLQSVTMPTSTTSVSSFANCFNNCYSLETLTMPATVPATLSNVSALCNGCSSLEVLTMPNIQLTSALNAASMFNGCNSLKVINNLNRLGVVTTTGNLASFGTNFGATNIPSLTFPQRLAILQIQGTTTERNAITSLRLTNTGTGQWTGASPQINISNTNIAYTQMIQLFNDIAAQGNVTAKTINITGATGTSSLTTADRQILTNRGWTITG